MLKSLNVLACLAVIAASGVYLHGHYIGSEAIAAQEVPSLTKAQAEGITTGLLCAMGDSVACATKSD